MTKLAGRLALLLTLAASARPQTPDAASLMRQVAAHQDQAQNERTRYLYDQHVRVVIRRTNGKLARQEESDLTVTPGAKGVQRKQQSISGRYWKKGQYVDFHGEPVPDRDNLDGSLAQSFKEDLLNDDSKDGLGKDLFPLTSKEQSGLQFELAGETVAAGRPAWRIRFRPADSKDFGWAGEALIDKEELQPVSVYTRLSRRLPLAVRTLLGTDVPGLGFSTRYQRVAPNVWFPVSFGTEFRLRAVFFINRTISVSMDNRHFQHASAESAITYGTPAASPPP